jgi:hypothetical protein
LGVWKSLDDVALKLSRACVPDTGRSEVYAAAIERQQRLYERVIGR